MPSSKKNSDIQYKAAPQGMVNLDEAEGIVECFVAGIGNKDSVGDVCAPGAFGKSLIRRKPRVVWGHNWNDPIGKVLDMYEVPPSDPRLPNKMKAAGIGGLYARVQFNLKSEKGREAFANVAFFGEEQEWSIGYKTINAKFDPQMQANILYEVELYEVSPVLHGANQLTGTISIKSEEQPASVLVNEQPTIDSLNINELSSVLDALKTIASVSDEKCGPGMPNGMPMTMPMGMPSGGPGMPSVSKPTQPIAPRESVKPEVPSMPENPMLVAIRRELVARTGSNIIVRSATENNVVFDRITSDGISSTYKLPYHFVNDEFMFGKPERINMQMNPESRAPEMPGSMTQSAAYGSTDMFDAGKSLISFDDPTWGEGFGQQIPAQQVDTSTLNNVISNLEKIIEEKSTYIIPVDIENAFEVKQAIDPILDYYRVDATVTEDGIVVKSLDNEFLDAMDIATKGVLRSIGNMIDRAVDRPNIGSNRRDRNPNLASRSRGIGSRGAVVRLSDGTMWDPKNAPDRNNNGIVGEGLTDGRGMSLSQPDPTPDGPNSINAPKAPGITEAPEAPKRTAQRLSSGRDDAEYARELAKQRESDRARGANATNPIGKQPAPKKETADRLSSGEWTKNTDGFEMDAPDIEGVYDVVEGLDGKFYVSRYSDYNRNGGQDAQEYEHDKPFSTLAAAKKWVEKDYAQAANEYMPDGMEDADSEDGERFSSGQIDFDKIGASGLKEMRHVERNPARFDTQADRDARDAYEKNVAAFRENNGWFFEVPMYSGDPKWQSEDWYRAREFATNVAKLRFEDNYQNETNQFMQFFDKPGKPSKKDFFARKGTVDYRSWYMAHTPLLTGEIDSVLNSDLYSDNYKESYMNAIRSFLYTNRPEFGPYGGDDSAYQAWIQQAGLGYGGRYSTSGPKLDEMGRFSSGATRGSKKDNFLRSYDNPEDLKEAMFVELIANNIDNFDDMTAEDLAYAINVRAVHVEPLLEDVKNNVRNSIAEYEDYSAINDNMTDSQMEAMAQDFARAQTVADKFAGMTEEEAADYAAWLDEETWRDRDGRFSSGNTGNTPEGRVSQYYKNNAELNEMLESMSPEELNDYAEQWNEEHREDSRLSSGMYARPKSTVTGEEFIGRSYGTHDWSVYDREDDFANIDSAIVEALLDGKMLTPAEAAAEDIDLSGPSLVRRTDEMGSNARRIAEAVANNSSITPSLKNQSASREDIVHFNYNGKQRSVYPETFATSKKGVGYFVGWDATADDGKGAYRSFNIDKIEGLASFAITPNDHPSSLNMRFSSGQIDYRNDKDYIALDDDNKKIADAIEQAISEGSITSDDSWYDLVSNAFVDAGGTDKEKHEAIFGKTTMDEWYDYASQYDSVVGEDGPSSWLEQQFYDDGLDFVATPQDKLRYVAENVMPEGSKYGDEAHIAALRESFSSGEGGVARLSSGGMPSTDEQRDLIDFAKSKKGSDFAASVVSQYNKNKRLSEKQWDALRRMRGGSAGGAKPAPKADAPSAPFSGKRRRIVDISEISKYDYPELPAKIKPTPEQDRAIDAMMTGADVKIGALAATGKTTTVINFANRLKAQDPSARVAYLVFNRNAKDDVMKRGMPGNVEVSTMDGIAYNAMDAINPEMTKKSFAKKTGHIPPIKSFKDRAKYLGVRSLVSDGQEYTDADVYRIVSKAIDAYSISDDIKIGPQHFTGAYNGGLAVTDESLLPELVGYANKMWEDMNLPRVDGSTRAKQQGMLPINNMHLTKMWALTDPDIGDVAGVNVAMVDEAQDMNPVFAGILRNSKNLQRIYIGDTNQAINAWRGADGTTLANAEATYDMPITDSFRFGKNVAGMGNRFLSLLDTKERMTGRKTDKSGNPVDGKIGPIDNPTMILTRSNGGAIAATMEVFKNGGTVYGSANFKKDLENFLNNIEWMQNAQAGKAFYTDVYGNQVFSAPEFSQDLDGITNIVDFNKAIEKADNNRLNMLAKLMDEYPLEELKTSLNNIITDKNKLPKNRDEYVHIQTAHTSKGLESPRVKIWTDFRKPKKLENGEWEYPNEQELRLSYVAVTRAEEELDLGSLDWILSHTDDADGEPNRLSSGRSKARGNRGDGKGRGKAWSDEDRQRFADRDVLRAQTRPGKRRQGPSASEFSSDDRFSSGRLVRNRRLYASTPEGWEMPEIGDDGEIKDGPLKGFYFRPDDYKDYVPGRKYIRYDGRGHYQQTDEFRNTVIDWADEDGDVYELGHALDRNIGSDEDIMGLFDSSEQEIMDQYGDEGLYYGNSSRGRYDPQNDYETSVVSDEHSPEDGTKHVGKAASVTDDNGNKLYGIVIDGYGAEYTENEPEEDYEGGTSVASDGGLTVLATHDADGNKLDKPVVVEGTFGIEGNQITNASEGQELYGPRISVSKSEVSEDTFDEAQKLYKELDPFENGKAESLSREAIVLNDEYNRAKKEKNRLSSGARFAPEGESNSRMNRRLSSGELKGPPPTGSGNYDRKKQVAATMGVFHSDPGTAIVPSDATGILGRVPAGKDSHVLNTAAAQKIIDNPDMEYSADNGWPVDAGRLLDFIEVNDEDAIRTLREIGDAQRIGSTLGIPEKDAQDMLDGKPVYIASSTAAEMFDNLSRNGAYPDSVRGLNDVARVWGFDGAPKWVRHSDVATPEFDLDENDMVNWSSTKWDGLSRAEFDAEVKRGANPPEPVYVSPVEFFNGDAVASNQKWDSRAGSFKNPTVDAEFAAAPKKLTRAEQLEPTRAPSQVRVGERTAMADKDFASKWIKRGHGISAANMMDILGIQRDSEGEQTTTADIKKLLVALNEIREKAGLPLIGNDGEFRPATISETKNRPMPDDVMHALVTSGRFKSMKEVVSALGDPRLDSLAAEYDSRMLTDAALIRIKDKMNKDGVADANKIIAKAMTAALGRKTDVEARVKEGRVTIKGDMKEDGMIGDAKISEILSSVNESLARSGYPEISQDELFPKDETGGYLDNLSSAVPGSARMSSGQRFVARTSSSRRADAMNDAASRRDGNAARLSSGESLPFRDENGKMVPKNIEESARAATPTGPGIDNDPLIQRKTPHQNLEDFEKAVRTRQEISKLFAMNRKNTQGFTVYDYEDELVKAGFPEEEIQKMIDSFVDLDTYIDDVERHFEVAREKLSQSLDDIEDSLSKIERLRLEKADAIKKWGDTEDNYWVLAIDDKIAAEMIKIDKAYQTGVGGEDGRLGTLHPQIEQMLSDMPGWSDKPYGMQGDRINRQLLAVESAITKAGGAKKAVPVTGIDFGVPEGTRLSSGKAEEYYQNLTSHLINMIEKSQKEGGKWDAPWHKAGNLPRNASTKNMYSGGNLFALMLAAEEKGYTTPHWGGFQQWKKLGGSVKKGEKATTILMPKQMFGEEIDPDTGKKIRKSKGVYFTTAHVFNLDQVEGIDREEFLKLPTDALTPEQRVGKLEDAIKEIGATINTGDGSRAYYSPREDHVVMPPFELFKSPEGYYGTLAHELVHWTGHSSRLDRNNMNQFGSPEYAREELIAEFGSAFLLAMFGLSAEPREDHAHYLANWLQVLRDEPNALQEASIKAQAASKMLIEKMKAVLEDMGEIASDAESTTESAADVKSLQIFNDPLYEVKDAYIEWSKDPLNAPFLVKSLDAQKHSSGLVNRSWERIAETAIFLERLSRKK